MKVNTPARHCEDTEVPTVNDSVDKLMENPEDESELLKKENEMLRNSVENLKIEFNNLKLEYMTYRPSSCYEVLCTFPKSNWFGIGQLQ